MGEEWHTAEAICRLSERLATRGARERMVALWNANNSFGFDRIDWTRLQASATITTVSRFMKQLMWDYGVNPMVVPNGIPQRLLDAAGDESLGAELRRAIDAHTVLMKVARWDPDKRWLGAVRTIAQLKARGDDPVLLARGGVEAHGREVFDEAHALGLSVQNVCIDTSTPDEFIEAVSGEGHPDVINITSPISQGLLRVLYREADAVLANSGREPFGLVGLETMAAGGTAYTGNTGEDYARHMENAVVLETEDPYEAAWYVQHLAAHPDEQERIRRGARETAQRFVWERVTANLMGKVELLASR
jgi:glycosyltransferase involved in cell wall biosynthesis